MKHFTVPLLLALALGGCHRGTAPDSTAPGSPAPTQTRAPSPSPGELPVPEASVADLEIASLGPPLRAHPDLGPEGANVNFVSYLSRNRFVLRTWERGVEGETLLQFLKKHSSRPITIIVVRETSHIDGTGAFTAMRAA